MSGKVALVTGAARGQGRAHAVRLSAEGADIIAVDIAGPLPASVPYDSPTPDDLAETARMVGANGQRVITAAVDVRHTDALRDAADRAVAELGRLDIIVANAGICCPSPWDQVRSCRIFSTKVAAASSTPRRADRWAPSTSSRVMSPITGVRKVFDATASCPVS